jgi:release factor glutamine methyltransferase
MTEAQAPVATVDRLIADAARRLQSSGIDGARAEARWLLARALSASDAELLARGERPVPPDAARQFGEWLARRVAREPFAYVVGEREFYGRSFVVNKHVLVPRPETETLLETALNVISEWQLDSPSPASGRGGRGVRGLAIDVGTGSGAIACTLALEAPDCCVVGSDVSVEAMAVAAHNRRRLGLDGRLALVRGGLLDWLGEPADLVVANLPYIPLSRIRSLMPEVSQWEPHLALDGGRDGADLIRALLADAGRVVRPGGTILLELDPEQIEAVCAALPEATPSVIRDLAGLERVLRLDLP